MKPVRILSVAFDAEIAAHETPAFRGAVIEKVGLQHELFHNHNNDPSVKSAYHYRYPLVQYKRQRRKPSIVFIDQGVDQAQHFFMQPDWRIVPRELNTRAVSRTLFPPGHVAHRSRSYGYAPSSRLACRKNSLPKQPRYLIPEALDFAGRHYNASISDLKVRTYKLGVTAEPHYYTLRHWAGLNQENYERFSHLESLSEEVKMLEGILAGHILGFAHGVGHRFRRRFDVAILHILGRRFRPFEGVGMLTFDLRFKADVVLPAYIGLGRGVSRGFGVVENSEQKFANN